MQVAVNAQLVVQGAHPDSALLEGAYRGCLILHVADAIPLTRDEPLQVSLMELKEIVKNTIDIEAERRRNAVLTPGSGQIAAYQKKETEARAYLADPDPDLAVYPYVAAEVGVTADTAADVAQVIVSMASAWWAYGAALERVRLTTKRGISAAPTPEAVITILTEVAWPKVG